MAAKKKSAPDYNKELAKKYLQPPYYNAAAPRRAPSPQQQPATPPPAPAPPPFMTGSDMLNDANFWADNRSQLNQAKFDLDNLLPQLEYQKTQNETNAKQATNQAGDEMAGRGLFQSSIKDAALADIEAQRALRAGLFNTQIQNARDQYALKAKALSDAADAWRAGMNQTMLDNARAQSSTQSVATPSSAPKPYQTIQAPGKDGRMYTWHVYPGGRRVALK